MCVDGPSPELQVKANLDHIYRDRRLKNTCNGKLSLQTYKHKKRRVQVENVLANFWQET